MYTEKDLPLTGLSDADYVYTAGVDWITVTTSEDKLGHRWQEVYHRLKSDLIERGIPPFERQFKMMSYQGKAIGGGLRVGYSPNLGWIAIASASGAGWWRKLIGGNMRVTRIDLAVTQSIGFEFPDVPRRYYNDLTEQELKQRTYSLIVNSKSGQTLYVGSRKSSRFGRVYDKGVEGGSAPPGFKYRYEVEFKKPLALQAARVLEAVREQEANTIVGMVFDFFDQRGISPLFGRKGQNVSLTTETHVTTLERKLKWIRTQVRPTAQELIMAGRSNDLFAAMGVPVSARELAEIEATAAMELGV